MFWASGLTSIFWLSGLILRVSGRAGGRPGRVTETFGGKQYFCEYVPCKTFIMCTFQNTDFEVFFTKNTRAERRRLVGKMCRDLSYETHLGPKTKID